jgi:peptidoglycan/LPS O-acetylase OafA/YrhL
MAEVVLELTRPQQRPEKLHALTSLRFFAAFYVVCFHSLWYVNFLPSLNHESFLGKVVHLGYTQVSFFFLLSGYILAFVYLRTGVPVALKKFFLARFARIYPLLFISLLADLPFAFSAQMRTENIRAAATSMAATLAGCAALLQGWTLRFRALNEPSWSLSVEAIFYLSFPFLGVALWKLRGAKLWLASAALYLGGQALVAIASRYAHGLLLNHFPPLHMTTFALGILLARWQAGQTDAGASARRQRHGRAYAVVALALAGCAVVVYASDRLPEASLNDGVLAPIFVALLWAFSDSSWLPAKLLSLPWLVVLGEASFGLYLIHIPVLHGFQALGWDRNPMMFPVFLALSIGLSVLSFYGLETPARRWILKLSRSRVKETMEMASDAQ